MVSTHCHLANVPTGENLGTFSTRPLGQLVAAAWLRLASQAHPEPTIAECPRCLAAAGRACTSFSRFMPEGFTHPERHAAAIAIDGRACEVSSD
jgi:hypothetical protein